MRKFKFQLLLILIVLLVIVGVVWFQNHNWSPERKFSGVNINNWNSAMGAVGEDTENFDKQKLSFWATIWNDSAEQSYVTAVKVTLPDSLRKQVISGDTTISVNQSLAPNATYEIKGEFILNTKGMTKQDIINIGNIQGFTLETR